MKSVNFLVSATLIGTAIIGIFAFVMLYHNSPVIVAGQYSVVNKWQLPSQLEEISGISWMDGGFIACVQDEDGVIFIYDLEKKKIVEQIRFAGKGDYEGIAVNGPDAYVMRSDGLIYEILRFRESEDKTISKFQTNFSFKNNMETLTMSADGSSLITAPKDRDRNKEFKGFYKIDIHSKSLSAVPSVNIIKIDSTTIDNSKMNSIRSFSPSDVAIHPSTSNYYVLEGINPKLMIINPDGKIQNVLQLDNKNFAQPEGLTFSPDGRLFISNEASNGYPTIVELMIK